VDQLQCNLVVVKRQDAKILRLNLTRSLQSSSNTTMNSAAVPHHQKPSLSSIQETLGIQDESGHSISDALSSPDARTPFTVTDKGTSSATSSDPGTSPALYTEAAPSAQTYGNPRNHATLQAPETDSDSECDEHSKGDSFPASKTANASPDLSASKHAFDGIPPLHMWPDFGVPKGNQTRSVFFHL
jgi:hypothetical protein